MLIMISRVISTGIQSAHIWSFEHVHWEAFPSPLAFAQHHYVLQGQTCLLGDISDPGSKLGFDFGLCQKVFDIWSSPIPYHLA